MRFRFERTATENKNKNILPDEIVDKDGADELPGEIILSDGADELPREITM